MTSIGSNLSQVVENAVSRGGASIPQGDVDKILSELSQGLGQDMVTLAEIRTIDSTLQRLVSQGRLSPQQAQAYGSQIRGAIDRAVANQTMQASAMASSWLQFAGQAEGTNQAIRQMAEQAAVNRHFFGMRGMTGKEVEGMLRQAAQDGTITLAEINAMYQGIHDAFQNGQINGKERDRMVHQLEHGLKAKAGKRRGMCARRIKGPYHNMLTQEAKDFVNTQLGGHARIGGPKGWTKWQFDNPAKVQNYVRAITQDGTVSPAERQALVNTLVKN
ncbi:MAG: hypothetical protein HYZ27_11960, partial [Deltaproteobacteria bacterium]|nr:hypothetical protein [Deltaproteobacteria bacterium]